MIINRFYITSNQKYFVISDLDSTSYFTIPNDKEGEKVKFIDKKSINDFSIFNTKDNIIFNYEDLEYTIQLYSDIKYENIENYISNLLIAKSELISSEDIFIFTINTQIGIDYFVSYKNFTNKNDAMSYCKNLSFVKKCLIIKPQN